MQTEDIIFSTKADARRVRRRLSDCGVLSFIRGRELSVLQPAGKDSVREIALRLHKEEPWQ